MKEKTLRASSAQKKSLENPSQSVLNPYESIIILKPSLTDEEVDGVLKKITEVIETQGGEFVSMDNWGKKKLAYEVQKERRGIYVAIHYKAMGSSIIELERTYRFSELIIKFINVRIDAEELGKSQPVKEDKALSFKGRDTRGWK